MGVVKFALIGALASLCSCGGSADPLEGHWSTTYDDGVGDAGTNTYSFGYNGMFNAQLKMTKYSGRTPCTGEIDKGGVWKSTATTISIVGSSCSQTITCGGSAVTCQATGGELSATCNYVIGGNGATLALNCGGAQQTFSRQP